MENKRNDGDMAYLYSILGLRRSSDKNKTRISNNSPLNCDLPITKHEKENDKNNINIERINTDSLISKDISSFLDSDEVMKKYTRFTISEKTKQKMIQTIDDNELINTVVDYLKDREDFYTILTTISSRIIELRKIKDND